MLWILQKKWRKALFNLRFNTPWFLHSNFKTRKSGFSGTTPEPLQTSTKHRFLFRQITFDHHWPTVILYVEDWQSSRQIDVIILKLFQKYLHTHYYLVADIRIRRYISISIHYNTSLKKPWHTFVFPNQDMWKLNMFIVSASDS